MTAEEKADFLTAFENQASKRRDALDAEIAVEKMKLMAWLESLEVKPNSPSNAALSAPADRLMTADDVAEYVGLKRETIYEWAKDNRIPHLKLNSEIRFRRSALDAWMTPNKDNIEKAREKARTCGKLKPLFPAANR